MSKKLTEFILLGGFLVLAVLLYGSTASYPQFVQGSTAAYVRFLAVSLGIFCAAELLLAVRRLNHNQNKQSEKLNLAAQPRQFWCLFIMLILYAIGFEYLGFYLSSALFLPITMFILGARKPLSIILTSAGILGFVYLVFERLLGVYMPVSSLFE